MLVPNTSVEKLEENTHTWLHIFYLVSTHDFYMFFYMLSFFLHKKTKKILQKLHDNQKPH